MKKNLVIASVVLIVFTMAFVSAGLFKGTGQVVSQEDYCANLSNTECQSDDYCKVSSAKFLWWTIKRCVAIPCEEGGVWDPTLSECVYPGSGDAGGGGAPAPSNCTDSDGGKDYYTKGRVSVGEGDSIGISDDWCPVAGGSFKYVEEYFCEDNEISSEMYECPNGCSDGACIQSSSGAVPNATSTVTYQGVLDMLNSCKYYESGTGTYSCDQICAGENKICIKSELIIFETRSDLNRWITVDGERACDYEMEGLYNHAEAGGAKLECLCCSAP